MGGGGGGGRKETTTSSQSIRCAHPNVFVSILPVFVGEGREGEGAHLARDQREKNKRLCRPPEQCCNKMGNNKKNSFLFRAELLQLALVVGLLRAKLPNSPPASGLVPEESGSFLHHPEADGEVWAVPAQEHRRSSFLPTDLGVVGGDPFFFAPSLRIKGGLEEEERSELRRVQWEILDDLNSLGRYGGRGHSVEIAAYVVNAPASSAAFPSSSGDSSDSGISDTEVGRISSLSEESSDCAEESDQEEDILGISPDVFRNDSGTADDAVVGLLSGEPVQVRGN